MILNGITLDGLNIIGVYGCQLFREKYDHIYIFLKDDRYILIKANEFLIEGGEVYEVFIEEVIARPLHDINEIFPLNSSIVSCSLLRRYEWYSPVDKTDVIIGNNPRYLNFGKNILSSVKNNSFKIVNCGILFSTSEGDILIYTSDYPGCIEVSIDRDFIDGYMRTAELFQ